jgi:hypothetical protein
MPSGSYDPPLITTSLREYGMEPSAGFIKSQLAGWLSTLKDMPAILATVGVLLYGIIYAIYSRYYNLLGIAPEEVGLGYGNILIRSILYLTTLALMLLVFTAILVTIYSSRLFISHATQNVDRMSRRDLEWFVNRQHSWRSNQIVGFTFRTLAVLFFAAVSLLFIVGGLQLAESYAGLVQAGVEVTPLRVGPVTMLDVRASPVIITWSGNATPDQKALTVHDLFALGQSGGTLILYDSTTQRAVRIPAGSVTSMAANCEAEFSPDSEMIRSNCRPDTINRPGVDLQNANLVASRLEHANLEYGNLRGADLGDAVLFGANLRRADLRGADLRGANLSQADLSGADFRGARIDIYSVMGARVDVETKWPKGFKHKGVTNKP